MLLSEPVYCVAIAFKMTERVEQRICIGFCIELEHSCAEPIWMVQRPQLWAAGDWQLHHGNMPAHASRIVQSILAKHEITQVTQPPCSPDLGPCNFWLFPKLKSPLKGKRFRKIQQGSGWPLELCEVPRCLLGRGLRRHCPLCNVSCVLYLLQ